MEIPDTAASDSEKLEYYEAIFEVVFRKSFITAGTALCTIRDQGLYREKYKDFDPTRKIGGGVIVPTRTVSSTPPKMRQALVLTNGNNAILPDCEGQLRPLTQLKDDKKTARCLGMCRAGSRRQAS